MFRELKREESNIFFDVNFDDEYEAGDNQNIVTRDMRHQGEALELKIKPQVLADEEISVSSETAIQVEYKNSEIGPVFQVDGTKNFTLTPEIHAPHFFPRKSVGPSPPRPPRTPVLQKRTQKTSDVQSTAQIVKPSPKAPTNLKLTGQ